MSRWVKLQREVRLSLGVDPTRTATGNSFAGSPRGDGLGPVVTLKVEVAGPIGPATGMLINIRQIDELVRQAVVSDFAYAADIAVPLMLKQMWARMKAQLAPVTLTGLEISSSPWLQYRLTDGDTRMIELTERFEFSAAHRLHSKDLTDAENKATFGKCNNPHGHGHNYELEVTLSGPTDAGGELISLQRLHDIVNQRVIDRMDHKHLNIEVAEFGQLNPTVENIAAVIFKSLEDAFPPPVRLQRIRLWETPKTSCTVEASEPVEKELVK